jgi:ATP-dependent Lhr-like helicase
MDELTFRDKGHGPRVLLLGGRSWAVGHIDWQKKIAYVEPILAKDNPRWTGEGPRLGFELCQSIHAPLTCESRRLNWSRRAIDNLREIHPQNAWVTSEDSVLIIGEKGDPQWWTLGRLAANA